MPDTMSVRAIIVQARQIMQGRGGAKGVFLNGDGKLCIRGAVASVFDPSLLDVGPMWAHEKAWVALESLQAHEAEAALNRAAAALSPLDNAGRPQFRSAVSWNNDPASTLEDMDRVFEKALELVSA